MNDQRFECLSKSTSRPNTGPRTCNVTESREFLRKWYAITILCNGVPIPQRSLKVILPVIHRYNQLSMKSVIPHYLLICSCLMLGSACQKDEVEPQAEPLVTPPPISTSGMLKSMSNYYYSTSEVPDEKFIFSYDAQGKLSAYDRYVPAGTENGMRRQLHFALEYAVEMNTTYKVTVWEISEGQPDVIVGRRRVHLDDNLNFVRDIIYDANGDKVMRENVYTVIEGGYSVLVRQWIEDYNQYGVTKVGYETDTNGNVTKKKVYNSHFEGVNVDEQVQSEYILTHDTTSNPLYNLTPYFLGFNSLNRYADSESKYNVVTLVPQECQEDCSSVFNYKFENGNVTEVSPGGFLLYKRTFEYY
jgi:hypothetical protein